MATGITYRTAGRGTGSVELAQFALSERSEGLVEDLVLFLGVDRRLASRR